MWGFKGGRAQAQCLNLIDWQSEIKPFRSCFHGAAANSWAVANHAERPGERKSYSAGLASLRVQPSIAMGLANEQTAPRWQGSASSVTAFGM